MSLLLFRRLMPAARKVGTLFKIPCRGAACEGDVPIRKGPFWDPGWPYPYMRPWMDVWDERQKDYLLRMDRALRVSPWRRVEGAKSQSQNPQALSDCDPCADSQGFGPGSDINRISLIKDQLLMEVELNVCNYEPEDLFVNQTGDWVIVNAQHTIRADKYGYLTRQFTRQIYLPEGLDKDTLVGRYTEKGNLVLSVRACDDLGFCKVEQVYGNPKNPCDPCDPCAPPDPCAPLNPCPPQNPCPPRC